MTGNVWDGAKNSGIINGKIREEALSRRAEDLGSKAFKRWTERGMNTGDISRWPEGKESALWPELGPHITSSRPRTSKP